jgi:hypothetical protein
MDDHHLTNITKLGEKNTVMTPMVMHEIFKHIQVHNFRNQTIESHDL